MSTRPGVEVDISSNSPTNAPAPTDTGTAYFAGITKRGRTDKAVLCHNMDDWQDAFGPRDTRSAMWDSAQAAFKTGVTNLYGGRIVGDSATKATFTFSDSAAAPSIAVDSIGAGTSNLKAAIIVGTVGGTVVLVITDGTTNAIIEQSPNAAAVADLVSWGAHFAKSVAVRSLGANIPAVHAAAALAGGNDQASTITDADTIAAVNNLFPPSLGVGQVAAPGNTSEAVLVALLNHAKANNRFALLDGPDTATAATAITALAAVQADAGLGVLASGYGMMSSPWRVVPGLSSGTVLVVPPCGVLAGLIATQDARGGDPNKPAAGSNGIDNYSVGSSQVEWSDADRQSLNNAGIVTFKNVYGQQRLYGFRTTAIQTDTADAAWTSAGAARLRMDIANRLAIIGEEYLFDEMDGQGHTIAAFGGACAALLQTYYAEGALYGDTSADAFVVDVGPTVNTPTTLANNELHAHIGIKISPFAEMIFFDVAKVDITEGF